MGVQDVGSISLGQWSAICRQRAKANGDNKPGAPTEDEFDAAVMAARGVS
jgi:hypothetical protein